jgi:hypothetical protein
MNKSDIFSRYLFVYLLLLLVEFIREYHNIFLDESRKKYILKKIAFGSLQRGGRENFVRARLSIKCKGKYLL